MSRFFETLVEKDLIEDWALILDWLLSDDRFSTKKGWNSSKVGQFTKKLKKLEHIDKSNFLVDTAKNISYEKIDRTRAPMIVMNKGDSEGRELLRHIRNGIAHGNVSLKKIGKVRELYITIEDFKSDFKSDSKTQTAYIHIPIAYISEIKNIYLYLFTQKYTPTNHIVKEI